jgi:hypothetical protein
MSTPSTALAFWDHGRLAQRVLERRSLGREQALLAAVGIAAAVVFALYVAVLETAVQRSDAMHAEQRARAIAEVDCEATHPAETRGACLAVLDGGAPDAVTLVKARSLGERFYAAYAGAGNGGGTGPATVAILATTPR